MSRLRNAAVHVILDWDGTLATKDTLHFLGKVCANVRSRTGQAPADRWEEIVNEYMDDYRAHEANYRPAKSERNIVEQESAWLNSLRPIENRSVKRVEEYGIFKGITKRDISAEVERAVASGELQLRAGWPELFWSIARRPLRQATGDELRELGNEGAGVGSIHGCPVRKLSILSVNWSRFFIEDALSQAVKCLRDSRLEVDEGKCHAIADIAQSTEIIANEVEGLDDVGGSSGFLNKSNEDGIRTSGDKLQAMSRMKEPGERVLYVGDSCTDLECLLEADIGVSVRDDPMNSSQKELSDTLQRLGIPARPLSEFSNHQPFESQVIWWARDLEEVARVILIK